jgi:hypothetical protein
MGRISTIKGAQEFSAHKFDDLHKMKQFTESTYQNLRKEEEHW